jgi:large subunit ribosomal protein L9
MASHIQVVLKEDVSNLGKTGELVRVRPGYARNYLLPRQLAAVATEGNISQIEHERKAALARMAKLKQESEGIASALSAITIEISRPVGEGDRLYGAVTSRDVAEALKQKGYDVDRKKLTLPDSIKQLGEYEVSAKLGASVTAKVKLVVKAVAT